MSVDAAKAIGDSRGRPHTAVDQFDAAMRDSNDLLDQDDEALLPKIEELLSFQIEEKSLECRHLEANPIFAKLKNRLRQFHVAAEEYRRRKGPSKQDLVFEKKANVDFKYRVSLHRGLKRLLREVVITKDHH